MNEIFNVGILRRDSSLRNVNLTLPATPYQLIDALEQLRVVSDKEVQTEIYYCHSSTTLNLLPTASGSLYEVNALAEKMASFEDWQKEAFDGMLKVDAFESSEPIPISRLIDFAYSTECCHVVGGVTTDQELGEFLVENDLWGDGETLSEEAYKALDFNAIGREHRLDEGGIFTANAYVEQHNALIEAHQAVDSKQLTLDYTILLEVRNNSQSSNEEAVPLKLPAIESELDDTLEQLGAASWKEVGFRCLDCKAPMLTDLICDAADISEINQLAATLAEMPRKRLTEYKAIL